MTSFGVAPLCQHFCGTNPSFPPSPSALLYSPKNYNPFSTLCPASKPRNLYLSLLFCVAVIYIPCRCHPEVLSSSKDEAREHQLHTLSPSQNHKSDVPVVETLNTPQLYQQAINLHYTPTLYHARRSQSPIHQSILHQGRRSNPPQEARHERHSQWRAQRGAKPHPVAIRDHGIENRKPRRRNGREHHLHRARKVSQSLPLPNLPPQPFPNQPMLTKLLSPDPRPHPRPKSPSKKRASRRASSRCGSASPGPRPPT